jgi:hypothetical protein
VVTTSLRQALGGSEWLTDGRTGLNGSGVVFLQTSDRFSGSGRILFGLPCRPG